MRFIILLICAIFSNALEVGEYEDDVYTPYRGVWYNSFDWLLLQKIFNQANGNVILSPFAIKVLLTIVRESSDSTPSNRNELSVLFPNEISREDCLVLLRSAINSIEQKDKKYKLNYGSSFFIDYKIQVNPAFTRTIQNYFHASVSHVDFLNKQQSAYYVNNWISNVTQGHIKDLVSLNDFKENAGILLINALYFQGTWKSQFDDYSTHQRQFFINSHQYVKTTFMAQEDSFYFYNSNEIKAKILRLAYKGTKFSMTIILPHEYDGLDTVIRNLASTKLSIVQRNLKKVPLEVKIPKFKFTYKAELKETLKSLGIEGIFKGGMRVSKNNNLKVENILQKSGIEIDEKGSTAFSATNLKLTFMSAFFGSEFIVDHPFIFCIEDETTGALLFAGKVVDPTYSN